MIAKDSPKTQYIVPAACNAKLLSHFYGEQPMETEMTKFQIEVPSIARGEFCSLIQSSEAKCFDSVAVRANIARVLDQYPKLGTYGFRVIDSPEDFAQKRALLLTDWGMRQICASLAFIEKHSKGPGGSISRKGGSSFLKHRAEREANGYVMEGAFVTAALMHGLKHSHGVTTYFDGRLDWKAIGRAPRGCASILIDGMPIAEWRNPAALTGERLAA